MICQYQQAQHNMGPDYTTQLLRRWQELWTKHNKRLCSGPSGPLIWLSDPLTEMTACSNSRPNDGAADFQTRGCSSQLDIVQKTNKQIKKLFFSNWRSFMWNIMRHLWNKSTNQNQIRFSSSFREQNLFAFYPLTRPKWLQLLKICY